MAVLTNSGLELNETAAPSTPATGKVVLYAKTDGIFYQKDDTGTETSLAGTIPVKATYTELNTGTDDAKFATALAIASSSISTSSKTETFTNKLVQLTAAPGADHTVSGTIIQLVAAQTQAIGDVCYIASTGKAYLAKADAIANANAVVMVADASIATDATGNYLVLGIARDDTWTWTVGGLVYLSTTGTTGNTLTQTAPSGANNVIQVLGVATHADRMLFKPSLVQVEHV